MVSVEIKIVTTKTEPYLRYHGKAVNQSLDTNFWSTQPDKIITTTGTGFTHTQTVEIADGSHYVIYGNSASAGYMWHAKIFINGTLIAEGDVDRGHQLRADFTIGAPPSPPLDESLLPAIASAIAGTLAVIWGLSQG